jgi:cytochrome c oxidase cbb3-type subunit 3
MTRSPCLGRRPGRCSRLILMLLVSANFVACEREHRAFEGLPPSESRPPAEVQSALRPGQGSTIPTETLSPYNGNAWAISEGKRLFSHFNCVGCHANGGGGIGPALMDDEWIYGFGAANIFATVVEGRPDGMPSFRNKITEDQIWQIVAYVESMSGHSPIDSLPGRSDRMNVRTPENVTEASGRRQTGHR